MKCSAGMLDLLEALTLPDVYKRQPEDSVSAVPPLLHD